jgi:glucose dehydrogenase
MLGSNERVFGADRRTGCDGWRFDWRLDDVDEACVAALTCVFVSSNPIILQGTYSGLATDLARPPVNLCDDRIKLCQCSPQVVALCL